MHACILLLICMHVNSVASKILGFGRSWELQAAAGWRDRQGERERERERGITGNDNPEQGGSSLLNQLVSLFY
jgi:hypothetical protein